MLSIATKELGCSLEGAQKLLHVFKQQRLLFSRGGRD